VNERPNNALVPEALIGALSVNVRQAMHGVDFLRAIREQPQDDALRLVYADWLEDHGEPDRAEFLRVQYQLEPVRHRHEDDRVHALLARENNLLLKHRDGWLAELVTLLGEGLYCPPVLFRRGFVDTIGLPVQWYLRHGEAIHELFPLLRRVQLFRVAGWGERLARSPVPERLEELEVPCWIRGEDAAAIAASPHLRHLRKLHLWLGNIDDVGADEAVCRALTPCAGWPRLAELRLTAVSEAPEDCRPGFEELARALGARAVFVNPWSRPYVFSHRGEGFPHNLPGRLPNGDQVFLYSTVDPYTARQSPVLLRFDAQGNQLGESDVAFPADCGPGRYTWPEVREVARRRGAFLRESLGHQPALIRVKSMCYGNRSLVGDFPYLDPERMGLPDDPEFGPEEDGNFGPNGTGGFLDGWVRSGCFTFSAGDDLWVDGNGEVFAS
jgi:uncharacterized protein (TIGR02996 family)